MRTDRERIKAEMTMVRTGDREAIGRMATMEKRAKGLRAKKAIAEDTEAAQRTETGMNEKDDDASQEIERKTSRGETATDHDPQENLEARSHGVVPNHQRGNDLSRLNQKDLTLLTKTPVQHPDQITIQIH